MLGASGGVLDRRSPPPLATRCLSSISARARAAISTPLSLPQETQLQDQYVYYICRQAGNQKVETLLAPPVTLTGQLSPWPE